LLSRVVASARFATVRLQATSPLTRTRLNAIFPLPSVNITVVPATQTYHTPSGTRESNYLRATRES